MTKYLVFTVASLALLLSAISSTSIGVAFPVLTTSFGASIITAGWVMAIYQLVVTIVMPLTGKASDVFGRKLVFMFSVGVFTVGSFLCAIAPNIESLIFFRFIQGIGAGGFVPSASGIVADAFPHSRQQSLGLFTSILPIGMIIGPNIGGWLVSIFGWRSVFWLNIPLGAVAFIASAILLKPTKREEGHMDLVGAGLFAGSLSAFMIGLSEIENTGMELLWVLVTLLFAASVILMVAFLRHERRIENPIIDMVILKERPFMAANIYNFVFGACQLGMLSFIPFYAVSIYGMSTLESGLIMTPRSVGMMITSTVTSFSLMRWGYRWPMMTGTIAVILSLFLLGLESPGLDVLGIHLSGTVLLLAIMLLLGLGAGVAAPAANNACIELMPNRVATIVGIRGMFRQSGGALSIAITSLVLNNMGSIAQGFYFALLGLAIIMIVVTPLIFLMPRSPNVAPFVKNVSLNGAKSEQGKST